MTVWSAARLWRSLPLLVTALIIPTAIILALWYGVNSDKDDIPPLLTQLIPAGHCTCGSSTSFECSSCLEPFQAANTSHDATKWTFEYPRDKDNMALTTDQCHAAFPGLYEDVEQGKSYWKSHGRIERSMLDKLRLVSGMTRAMIYEGRLYVIASVSNREDQRRKIVAMLSSIHRALSAAGTDKIPNIEFVFSTEDKASDVSAASDAPIWVLARKPTERSLWLIPDFGYWAWDNVHKSGDNEIGPFDEVVDRALAVEKTLAFDKKKPQLVWRGKLSFAPKLRRALLEKSRGKAWNDVKEIHWKTRENFLTLEDHCRYQYIAHVEGRSYSGSLKYRQACDSVIVAHKLQYIQHHHYLLVADGKLQNYVQVERDYSDLDKKMSELLANPTKARAIADRSVKTFRERYLTPAAEACYWRALWTGYATVSERATVKRGKRFEAFALLEPAEMMDFGTA